MVGGNGVMEVRASQERGGDESFSSILQARPLELEMDGGEEEKLAGNTVLRFMGAG